MDQGTDRLRSDSAALISAKDETIAALRDQLEAERQAHAEARRLLMAALERIPPQLEAPSEAPEASETATQHPQTQKRPTEGVEHEASTLREWSGDVESRPDAPGAQEGAWKPWWRRVFGG
jgi:hypothetical protein